MEVLSEKVATNDLMKVTQTEAAQNGLILGQQQFKKEKRT